MSLVETWVESVVGDIEGILLTGYQRVEGRDISLIYKWNGKDIYTNRVDFLDIKYEQEEFSITLKLEEPLKLYSLNEYITIIEFYESGMIVSSASDGVLSFRVNTPIIGFKYFCIEVNSQ